MPKVKWKKFRHKGAVFTFDHLHPFLHHYVQPAKDGKPERSYEVWVEFSHHCFTSDFQDGDDEKLIYPSPFDRRVFDKRRYALSHLLTSTIRDLIGRKCFHGSGAQKNFFVVELANEDGKKVDYEIYFKLVKTSEGLRLFVQSAFPRDAKNYGNRPKGKPIRFEIILYNTLHEKKIRR